MKECYICEEEMEHLETLVVSKSNMIRHYICHNCGEEIYERIKEDE